MIRHILFTNKENTKETLVYRGFVYPKDPSIPSFRAWKVMVNHEHHSEVDTYFPTMNAAMKRANEIVEEK